MYADDAQISVSVGTISSVNTWFLAYSKVTANLTRKHLFSVALGS